MDTVTDDTRLLQDEGYVLEADVRDGQVHLRVDGEWIPAPGADVERIMRYEGTSDPGDETIVLGVHDPASDRRGILVSAYGPNTDPDTAACLRGLLDHRDS